MRRIGLNSIWLLLARAGSQSLLLFFTILVARALGEVGLGQYAFAAAVVYVGNVFTTFGLDTLLIRETARKRHGDDSLLTTALALQLGLSALFVLGVLLLSPLLGGQKPETLVALRLYSLSLLPLAFATAYSAVLRGFERMDLYLVYVLGTAVAQTLGALIILRAGAGLRDLMALLVAVQILGALLAWLLCRHGVPGFAHRWAITPDRLRATLRAGTPLAFLMVLAVVYQRLGVFALSAVAGDAATGWYSAAARLVEAGKILPYAVFGALFPVMARGAVWTQGSGRKWSFWGLLSFALLAALVLNRWGAALVGWLYGPGYAPAAAALGSLAWSLLPFVVTLRLSFELVAARREREAVVALLVALGGTAVLLTLFIPRHGPIGAAWAVVLGETLQATLLLALRTTKSPGH